MHKKTMARNLVLAFVAAFAAVSLLFGTQASALQGVQVQAASENATYAANTWVPLEISINNQNPDYGITVLEAGFDELPSGLELKSGSSLETKHTDMSLAAGSKAYTTVHTMEVRKVKATPETPTTPKAGTGASASKSSPGGRASTAKTADVANPVPIACAFALAVCLAALALRRMKQGGALSILLVGVLAVGGLGSFAALPAPSASAAVVMQKADCQITVTIDGSKYTFDGYVNYYYTTPGPGLRPEPEPEPKPQPDPEPKPETMDITLVKTWDDADNQDRLRPTGPEFVSALVLTADGSVVADVVPRVSTVSGSNVYTVTWEALPKTNDAGDEIVYAVEEGGIEGYTAGKVTGSAASGFAITNTHTPTPPEPDPETVDVTGTKKWEGDNGKEHDNAAEVKLTLFRQAGEGEFEEVAGAEPAWNGNAYTFAAQPKADASGTEYTYYVSEEDVEGYDREYTDAEGTQGLDFAPNGGIIVNTYIKPASVSINVGLNYRVYSGGLWSGVVATSPQKVTVSGASMSESKTLSFTPGSAAQEVELPGAGTYTIAMAGIAKSDLKPEADLRALAGDPLPLIIDTVSATVTVDQNGNCTVDGTTSTSFAVGVDQGGSFIYNDIDALKEAYGGTGADTRLNTLNPHSSDAGATASGNTVTLTTVISQGWDDSTDIADQ